MKKKLTAEQVNGFLQWAGEQNIILLDGADPIQNLELCTVSEEYILDCVNDGEIEY